tara:strand:+ start:12281 stop:12541 length:261 start_codon:yes stop_codon:yes gene_type:complete
MASIPGMRINVIHPPKPVRRSWWERLCSRPWRPWKKFYVPHDARWEELRKRRGCYLYGDTIFCTPEFFSELQANTLFDEFPDLMRP